MPELFNSPAIGTRLWPASAHLLWFVLGWIALVVYGSLTPFHYQPREWSEAAEILRVIAVSPPQAAPRSDWATNFLLLVPFGFAALGALLVDRDTMLRRAWAIPLVLAAGLILSVGVESAQLWFPPRNPAKADVIAQTLGNVLGMGLWILAGQTLTGWTRRHLAGPRASRAVWLLAIYAMGLLVYSLMPLDLTLRPGELYRKWKGGTVVLIPFRNFHWDLASLFGAVRDAAVFIPVGMLAALWPWRNAPSGRGLAMRWLTGVGMVAAIELAQLFVKSRHSDATDLILGALGVTLGLVAAFFWRGSSAPSPNVGAKGIWLRWACLVGYILFLTAVYLEPFEMIADHNRAAVRLAAMARVPLEALRQGELLEMFSNVCRKLLLFGVLGWLAAETASVASIKQLTSRRLVAWGLLAGLITATVIEIAQAWFPPHLPDVTDILWGTVFGAIGARLRPFLAEEAADGPQPPSA